MYRVRETHVHVIEADLLVRLVPRAQEDRVRPIGRDGKARHVDFLAESEATFERDLLAVLRDPEEARLVIDVSDRSGLDSLEGPKQMEAHLTLRELERARNLVLRIRRTPPVPLELPILQHRTTSFPDSFQVAFAARAAQRGNIGSAGLSLVGAPRFELGTS
jgi:hypothetical protein